MSPLTRLKRKLFSHPRLCRVILASLVVTGILLLIRFTAPTVAPRILSTKSLNLKNDNGRTNFLILGIGGTNHDGPDLTDTMLIVSAVTKFETDNLAVPPIALISVPRDIYLDSLQDKINAAYSQGISQGVGLDMAKGTITQVTGLPIHYAVAFDFAVFERIIDIIGGIDVNVPNTFDDYEYPIDGKENDDCNGDYEFKCRYEHLHFDAGIQRMDGKTALRFVRSRKAAGDEGTDFARSRRQQLVIAALRDKFFSTTTFLNVGQNLAIYNELKSKIVTDFEFSQPEELLKLAYKYRQAEFNKIVIDETLLFNPPEDWRGWILLPKNNSWDGVRLFIKEKLASPAPKE